jgi:hypothetical protein
MVGRTLGAAFLVPIGHIQKWQLLEFLIEKLAQSLSRGKGVGHARPERCQRYVSAYRKTNRK